MSQGTGHTLWSLTRDIVGGRVLGDGNPAVTGVTHDSRRVGPGFVFVAIRGAKADGHGFIGQAVADGAVAVVCEQPPFPLPGVPVVQVPDSRRALSVLADRITGSPSRRLRVTGITGTDGKTSTTAILRTVLTEGGRPAGSIGTLGYWIEGPWTDANLTTPDPIALHESFRRMLDIGLTDVCMEVSSHSLIQHRVADVDFDAAILTNITHDHLDTHGTRANYALAKRILFEGLKDDAVAILPAGGEFTDDFRSHTQATVLTYGMENLADVQGSIISKDMGGMEILIRNPFEVYSVRTSLIGTFNCLNILAAATAAFAFRLGGEVVKESLRGFHGVPGRLERVAVAGRDDLPAVLVDFAHTPFALQKVLSALRPLVQGRLVCVVGCGGDRDRTKRPIMGQIATSHADMTVFTADNSRSEKTEDIIAEMLAGLAGPSCKCRIETDRRRAIRLALELADDSDSMVVLCGKGCERYLDLGEGKIPFDDRAVARQIMQEMPLLRRKSA